MNRLLASPWLAPLIGLVAIGRFNNDLVDVLGYGGAAAVVILLGTVLGIVWYRGAPRPLLIRLFPFGVIGILLAVLAFVPGDSTTVTMPAALSMIGIVFGLALAEYVPTTK